MLTLQDTIYIDDIEERENAGTPQIIQTIRAALAFWVKDFVGCQVIQKLEHEYISEAIERLLPNRNIEILGNKIADRQAILSFIVHSTTNSSSSPSVDARGRFYMWEEVGSRRDKPLHGAFVTTLLNDLFGIQARGGCACAGPYGHALLGIPEAHSLAIRSAIEKVSTYMDIPLSFHHLTNRCLLSFRTQSLVPDPADGAPAVHSQQFDGCL